MNRFFSFLLAVILLLSSCNDELNRSLDFSESNRPELEKVLEYFKDDPNPLKYKAAQFLIKNMPYHISYYGDGAKRFDDAYIIMAKNAKEFRDSVINRKTQAIANAQLKRASEIKTMKADYLIKAIDEACSVWEKVNWSKDYDESLFFNYVLPYRVYDEMLSDWREEIRNDFSYISSPIVYSEKGVQYPAYKAQIANAKVVEAPNALKGKVVQMDRAGASITYCIHTDLTVQKLINFSYNTMLVDVKASVD